MKNVGSFALAQGWDHNPILWAQLVPLLCGILSSIFARTALCQGTFEHIG